MQFLPMQHIPKLILVSFIICNQWTGKCMSWPTCDLTPDNATEMNSTAHWPGSAPSWSVPLPPTVLQLCRNSSRAISSCTGYLQKEQTYWCKIHGLTHADRHHKVMDICLIKHESTPYLFSKSWASPCMLWFRGLICSLVPPRRSHALVYSSNNVLQETV